MDKMDPKSKTTGKPSVPEGHGLKTFRAKLDESTDELTLDQTLLKIAELYRQSAPLVAQLKNLKQVAKEHLKARGEKSYQMENGIKAQFISSQKSKVNKELAKEICGPRWAEVEKFVEEISFKVTVPGVKSPDAD